MRDALLENLNFWSCLFYARGPFVFCHICYLCICCIKSHIDDKPSPFKWYFLVIFSLSVIAAAAELEPLTLEWWGEGSTTVLLLLLAILRSGNTNRGSITVPLTPLFDWFGISCMTTDIFCFYLKNRLIQTSQTGGQWYSDTSPFSIPCLDITASRLVEIKKIKRSKNFNLVLMRNWKYLKEILNLVKIEDVHNCLFLKSHFKNILTISFYFSKNGTFFV